MDPRPRKAKKHTGSTPLGGLLPLRGGGACRQGPRSRASPPAGGLTLPPFLSSLQEHASQQLWHGHPLVHQ